MKDDDVKNNRYIYSASQISEVHTRSVAGNIFPGASGFRSLKDGTRTISYFATNDNGADRKPVGML